MNHKAEIIEVEEERSDFLPYACHFDEATLLTKNGELIQTLKIEGFQFNQHHEGERLDLRAKLRQALTEHTTQPHFCSNIYMVRRPKDLRPTESVPGYFASDINKKWESAHGWQDYYSNDLYITIVHEGADFSIANPLRLLRSFLFLPEKAKHKKKLLAARDALSEAVEQILASLQPFGVKKLALREEGDAFYSEPLSLLNQLTNLNHGKKIPAPVSDIADALTSSEMSFDFNTIIARNDERARFAAIYSLKQYREILGNVIDRFLQFPCEFVISHHVMLGADSKFVKGLEHKKRMAELGEDAELLEFSGVNDLLNDNHGHWNDYALQQVTITLYADSEEELEQNCGKFAGALASIGLMAIREDIMLEHLYYSQMPANFKYLKRQQPINTNHVAGYATLYDFTAGKLIDNHWGPALATLKTDQGNPYFFSFHKGHSGHSVIAGPYGSAVTSLLNFMMTQSERALPEVVWFDTHHRGEMTIRALGGSYMNVMRNKEVPKRPMNPLLLEKNHANQVFLEEWLKLLVLDLDGVLKVEPGVDFAKVVEEIFAIPVEERSLEKLKLTLAAPLSSYFEQWLGDGRYGHLFNHPLDETFIENRIHGFNLTEMIQDRRPHWAIFSYLMHCALQRMDGEKPTIFVFDEAWAMFENPVFSARITEWLEKIEAKNGIAIFITEQMDNIPQSSVSAVILQKATTKLLFPHEHIGSAIKNLMNMDDAQYEAYARMRTDSHQVYLQQGAESVMLDMHFPLPDGIMNILNGAPAHVTRMENIIAKMGTLPDQWLPEFYRQSAPPKVFGKVD